MCRVSLLLLVALAAFAQTTSKQNEVRDRGKTPVQPPGQTMERGRIGAQVAVPPGAVTLRGLLVDAGCWDRSNLNLGRPPETLAGAAPAETPQESAAGNAQRQKQGYAERGAPPREGSVSASGINVDAATVAAERAGVLEHQERDLVSRQSDPTCAIKGSTRGFALLLGDGRLVNLDEGGNTFATAAVSSSPRGRSMLNGLGPGFKPVATVIGQVRGDTVIASSVQLEP
jgi:hypothetical protein